MDGVKTEPGRPHARPGASGDSFQYRFSANCSARGEFVRLVIAPKLVSPTLVLDDLFREAAGPNVGVNNVEFPLQFVNVRTGSVIASCVVALLPPGQPGPMTDPCLTTTADAVLRAGRPPAGESALMVAIVEVRRPMFGRLSAAATAGLEISATDASGARHAVASVPLLNAGVRNQTESVK